MKKELEKWLQELQLVKSEIDEKIIHLEALLKLNSDPGKYNHQLLSQSPENKRVKPKGKAKSKETTNIKDEVMAACEKMKDYFTAPQIRENLSKSSHQKLKNITATYVCKILTKLVKENKIIRTGRQSGKKNIIYYKVKR